MSYEKTQKGNPHELTIYQHHFPAASIARFAGSDGCVEVHLIPQNKEVRLKPEDQLFSARRVWDQRAESGYMKEIEDKYQELATAVVAGVITSINGEHQSIITDMFALWYIRGLRRANPISDQKIEGVIGLGRDYSKDDREKLEKNHISIIRPDLTVPGRHLCSANIQLNLFQVSELMPDAHWGILRAKSGHFIVPDNFSNARILPLSPLICFFSQSDDDEIEESEVAEINRMAIEASRSYYLANELAKCPR
jgi:hypothetical protein